MIGTIGLYWNVEDVFWGRRNRRGNLLGVPEKQRLSAPIDFREQIAIYVLYADFHSVYAGQVGMGKQRLFERLKQHRTDDLRGRWNRFSWYGLRRVLASGTLSNINKQFHPKLADVLNHVEGILIDATEPRQNSQSGRFGKDVVWYLQHRDIANLGEPQSEMLKKVYDATIKSAGQKASHRKRARWAEGGREKNRRARRA